MPHGKMQMAQKDGGSRPRVWRGIPGAERSSVYRGQYRIRPTTVVRLTKALTNAVASKKDAKDEWFAVVGGLVASPTPFHNSIAEGIYQSLADDIAAGKGYTVGFVA